MDRASPGSGRDFNSKKGEASTVAINGGILGKDDDLVCKLQVAGVSYRSCLYK